MRKHWKGKSNGTVWEEQCKKQSNSTEEATENDCKSNRKEIKNIGKAMEKH